MLERKNKIAINKTIDEYYTVIFDKRTVDCIFEYYTFPQNYSIIIFLRRWFVSFLAKIHV